MLFPVGMILSELLIAPYRFHCSEPVRCYFLAGDSDIMKRILTQPTPVCVLHST